MAQPAVPISRSSRTDLLGVPVFWRKSTSDPPSSWDSWIGQFNLAITLQEQCDPRELLKLPGLVHTKIRSRSQKLSGLVRMRLRRPTELQETRQLFEESMKLMKNEGRKAPESYLVFSLMWHINA